MATEVFMPKAGMDMQEGTIIRWFKKVGEEVEAGESLLEIETDKVTMEIESPATGVLLSTYFDDGAVVPVVKTIAYIGAKGEEVPRTETAVEQISVKQENIVTKEDSQTKKLNKSDSVMATPYAKKLATENNINLTDVFASGNMGQITGKDVKENIKATPLATKIAEDKSVNLANISGSGHDGKITKADVMNLASANLTAKVDKKRTKLSGIRKVVCNTMIKAHLEIPPVTMNMKVDVTELISFRKKLNVNREVKFTINDLVLKAVAKSLLSHKNLLLSLDGDEIIHHDQINIGMAVALEAGLIVPVIKDADKMGLEVIAEKARDLSTRARDNKLEIDECKGSTITITNMGMLGIESFTPIINMPDSMILGVCAIEDVLALKEETVYVSKKMGLSLTFDHRLLDGVQPARFLNTLKSTLENPIEILL